MYAFFQVLLNNSFPVFFKQSISGLLYVIDIPLKVLLLVRDLIWFYFGLEIYS